MITLIRKLFQSKIGIFFSLAFVGLIGIAFAGMDMTGNFSFAGAGNANAYVAEVESEKIGVAEFTNALRNAHQQVQQQNPQIDMATFLAEGGAEQVLNRMIDSQILNVFAQQYGMATSKRLIDKEILKIPAFHNAAGKFDETIFRTTLQQAGFSESELRADIARALLTEKLLVPVSSGAVMPIKLASPYASLSLERRAGQIALVPSIAFAPKARPGDQAIKAYYDQNKEKYRLGERRVIQYVSFDIARFRDKAKVSDADIKQLYEARKGQYAARDERQYSQLIVPTEDAAKEIAKQVASGKSLNEAAAKAGLSVANIEYQTRAQIESGSNKAFAQALFQTKPGTLSPAVKTPLGWQIAMVDEVRQIAAKSMVEVRAELEKELLDQKLRELVNEFTDYLDGRLSDGASLEDIAKSESLELKTSPALFQNSRAAKQADYQADETVSRVLPTIFTMTAEDEPQLAEIIPGESFAIFDVSQIIASAPQPLAEIKQKVEADLVVSESSKAARKMAEQLAKSKDSAALSKAVQQSSVRLPQIENINTNRLALSQNQGRVPPPVALMFSMAKGTTKILRAPDNQGWFVVHLEELERGKIEEDSSLLRAATAQMRNVLGEEYSQQLLLAMRKDYQISRNQNAINQVSEELSAR